ncbi:nucleotidyl cyclase domain-containing protein [Streptomyces albogriseolus]|uniref:adenylate/guanylate cyclase n=1 Tax=Streptomyces albogriseolus TaxID=1887 RepID=UPI0037FB1D8E
MISDAQHSQILFADIKEFGSRSDHAQLRARSDLYTEMTTAFTDDLWRLCRHEDRGDGVLVVIPPDPALPMGTLFTDVLPRLEDGLGSRRRSDPLLRLRIAVHAGPVHRDRHGFAGHAVNHVFRLCDGAPLRQALDEAVSDTAALVSDTVHDAVIRAGLPGVEPAAFHPVTVQVKETRARAYLHVPGDPACAPADRQGVRARRPRRAGRRQARRGVRQCGARRAHGRRGRRGRRRPRDHAPRAVAPLGARREVRPAHRMRTAPDRTQGATTTRRKARKR